MKVVRKSVQSETETVPFDLKGVQFEMEMVWNVQTVSALRLTEYT